MATNTPIQYQVELNLRHAIILLVSTVVAACLDVSMIPVRIYKQRKHQQLLDALTEQYQLGYRMGALTTQQVAFQRGVEQGFNLGVDYFKQIHTQKPAEPDGERWL